MPPLYLVHSWCPFCFQQRWGNRTNTSGRAYSATVLRSLFCSINRRYLIPKQMQWPERASPSFQPSLAAPGGAEAHLSPVDRTWPATHGLIEATNAVPETQEYRSLEASFRGNYSYGYRLFAASARVSPPGPRRSAILSRVKIRASCAGLALTIWINRLYAAYSKQAALLFHPRTGTGRR